MKDSTRARVAAVVGAAYKGNPVSSVYDYSSKTQRNTSVSISNGQIIGYDHMTSSPFSGGASAGILDFYDHETKKHVQLKLDGSNFSGYDYNSEKHFFGTINGGSISLYDYETGKHYNFNV
jgi:hypothetical protein